MATSPIQKLASAIAKREGKRSQARIGDIREILKVLCTMEAESLVAGESVEQGPMHPLMEQAGKIADRLRKKRRAKS